MNITAPSPLSFKDIIKSACAVLFTVMVPALTWADDAAIQAQLATAREDFAAALAKELYCQAATTIGGDLGLMIGLCISAFALYCLIFKGPSLMFVVLFVFGLLITSLPSWFQATYHSLETLTAPLASGGTQIGTDLRTSSFASNCDYNSTSLKQYMTSLASGLSSNTSQSGGSNLPTGNAATYSGDFADAITAAEGGAYDLDHLNGAYGRYGFRMRWARAMLNRPDLTVEEFLGSPELQDQAFATMTTQNLNDSRFATLENLSSNTYGGSSSQSHLIAQALAHTYGVGGAVTCLSTGSCPHSADNYLRNAGLID